jgi:hypothetical protein
MEIIGMWLCIAGIMITVWYVIKKTNSRHYDNGYWAGRSAGWKASNEHREKLRRMKSRAVFDYDKN